MGTEQKKKKRTDDVRSTLTEIKRTQDLDINKLALEPSLELGYSPIGVGTTSYVNVSTSIGPSQGGSGFPAQVTGLTVTPQGGSDTQLNLAWTATTLPAEFNYYNVYRGPTGFTVDPSFIIAQPITNSYNNTGLTAGTTYYYRVSITNDAILEGAPSSQVSGTTTGSAPLPPSLELHFDNNLTDTSPNGHVLNAGSTNNNGFFTPGQFGSAAKKINYPSSTDILFYDTTATLSMDPTVGFSISVWVYPVSFFSGTRKVIVEKCDDSSNRWTLQVEPSNLLVHFHVKEAGTDYKRVTAAGLTVNAWNHIAATFNSSSNTVAVYNAAVAGSSSSAVTQYDGSTSTNFVIGTAVSTANSFLGYIDELRYYKGVVLTPTQITNLKNTNAT